MITKPRGMSVLRFLCPIAMLGLAGLIQTASAQTYSLRVGAGLPAQAEMIGTLQSDILPEIKKRVESTTKYKINFTEAYGGTVASHADVLEATEKGLFDLGVFCACLEPTKAFYLAFSFFLPFVSDDPVLQTELVRKTLTEYPAVPAYLEKYNQKFLGLAPFAGYGLATKFKWSNITSLKGKKIAGAGPNLPWLNATGATPVQSTVTDGYNALQSGVYEGFILPPNTWQSFKLNEVAPVFTITGWGAIPQFVLSVNLTTWKKFPPEIRKIIEEAGASWEIKSAGRSKNLYDSAIIKMKAAGMTIQELPFDQRVVLAKALATWPGEQAKKTGKQYGLPMGAVMERYLALAEERGVKLPHRYKIQ